MSGAESESKEGSGVEPGPDPIDIKAVVDTWPPLNDFQRIALGVILGPEDIDLDPSA